ncbi:alpha/beta fold hydrolase [Phytohalomonas tamaricis]|uniref:alpha/beta fold hydrolase n=1 Tax=Phytohalomonas tamaricis TaxID=2081032 RepID=UPI000D0B480C|nr:alpha/beta hydrolase [Phytohalomonas tamaricis]
MLAYIDHGKGSPTFILMHFLGGSHRTWSPTLPYLEERHRCIAVDMPGFGDSKDIEGYSVKEMLDHVDATIRDLELDDCILVGHSMTGKVALALAARRPEYLKGIILVAPSPATPQPMKEEQREKQINYQGTREEAEGFIDGATAQRLPDDLREIAIADVMRVNLEAYHAWPKYGSQEDWSGALGEVSCPALLVAGGNDQNVPPVEEQKRITLNHLPNHRIEVIESAGHLMPLETPQQLAKLMLTFADGL